MSVPVPSLVVNSGDVSGVHDAVPPQTTPEVLTLELPRYVSGSAYLLLSEDVFTNEDGELWQSRTWFNADDGTSWQSLEDLGAAASLVREMLYVDVGGVLWRVRTWSDPAVGAAWVTQEDLGAFAPSAALL